MNARAIAVALAAAALAATAADAAPRPKPATPTTTRARAPKGATMSATLDRSRPPHLPPAPRPVLPRMTSLKLANGLELDVVEMHAAPVVDVTLLVRAGAVRDPDDLPGLATFTANMLDEGAGRRTSLQIAEEVDYLGATLSANGGIEVSQVNLHAPKTVIGEALDVFADVVLRPTFPDSEVARQRELRKTALLQLRDQPNSIAPLAFNAVLFGPGHPYGRPANGNEASTAALDRARVAEFHTRWYRPNNARLLFVGDITPAEAHALAEARFGGWAAAEVPAPPSPSPKPAAARAIYIVDKPGAPQSVIRIGNVGVPRSTPDYFPIQVMNTLLGGAFTSRLNQNLREAHGYTYGATSGFEMRRLAGPFRAGASVGTAVTDSAVVEFLKELRRIRDAEVPADELAKTRQLLALGLPGDFETSAATAQRFVDVLANDLPPDTWDRYVDGVEAVTAADVQRVARTAIDPDHFVMLVVGDRAAIEPGLKALNEGAVEVRDLWGGEVRP